MTYMRPKLVATLVVFAVSMLVVPGCVWQSKYEAAMADLKKQADELSKAEQEKAQLQTDLDAAKAVAEKVEEAKTAAETDIATLEEENAELTEQAEQAKKVAETDIATLKQENVELKKLAEQAKKVAETDIATLQQENVELKKQADKLSQVEQEQVQLQKDLDAAKAAVEKAEQGQTDAEARIKTLEEENAALKEQAPQSEGPAQ